MMLQALHILEPRISRYESHHSRALQLGNSRAVAHWSNAATVLYSVNILY
ncbi:hypothetical protein BDA96_10G173400 [Sorghum bicolor]|uniref:Uncharacterized protein n=2 Tax=Sorghum bicolor TaxID=4558 RepID=A0A921Q3Q6_SORBI|nr:hypothetical protein BDA96_10G173400 [Sorghum bicolor]OQU76362.1 hypothetical protein SORBI_3010G136601 [Sorghum bicolor]